MRTKPRASTTPIDAALMGAAVGIGFIGLANSFFCGS